MRHDMEFKDQGKLPGKPSELIKLAINDLKEVERDPRYRVDMDQWHRVGMPYDDRCHLCLAGAVMAGQLGVDSDEGATPGMFDELKALRALDEFRQGELHNAFGYLSIDIPNDLRYDIEVPDYSNSRYNNTDGPKQFKEAMLFMADELARKGY